jgi:hypothetical protein
MTIDECQPKSQLSASAIHADVFRETQRDKQINIHLGQPLFVSASQLTSRLVTAVVKTVVPHRSNLHRFVMLLYAIPEMPIGAGLAA